MAKLESIISKGNRGHYGSPDSTITCKDGTVLSVIAGGGAYSTPRPDICSCAYGGGTYPTLGARGLAHDYPGPYSAAEVMIIDGTAPDGWDEYDAGGVFAFVPADLVRAYVESHGGEA